MARSRIEAGRALLAYLLPVLLASMACPHPHREFGPPVGNPLAPGQFLLRAVDYSLQAGTTSEQGSCEFDVGLGCPASIGDLADGPASDLAFALWTPTEGISSVRLAFYLGGSSGASSGEVTATAETTLYSATGERVFARVRRSELNLRGPVSTTDDFSLRIGAGGAPIAIPVGDDFTEVTLPPGVTTLFADIHVTLSEAAGNVGDSEVDFTLEIVADAPCKTDARCPSDQKCVSPAGVCTSGALGEDCADPQDCDTGFCYSGRCSDGSPGSFCTIDRDCQDYCANTRCQAGNENDYCTAVEQCNFEGAHCPQVFAGYGLCTDGGNFDPCIDDADCDGAHDGNGGVCGPT